MVLADRPALESARAALAAEWEANPPTQPDEILSFYRDSQALADDLAAWHQTPGRQSWTAMLVHVAGQSGARSVVDIGCGAGYDLLAIQDAYPEMQLAGVELNYELAKRLSDNGLWIVTDVADARIEDADLLVCLDVLEHVPDPETFLADIAERAKVGAYLFETVGNEDCTTPLHLPSNRGWHPGRVLERHGFELQDTADRVRVWKRTVEAGIGRAALLLCAYRGVTSESLASIMSLTHGGGAAGWRLRSKTGDSWIGRSRSIIVTKWWQETNDDVFLMIDDDVAFGTADAERVVELCRGGLPIVCGAYPVHNGAHLSLKCFPGLDSISFGPGQPPLEIRYAATGFMAVHRRVIDALIPTLPLVSPRQPWAYYPLFPTPIVTDEEIGEPEMLSEDWGFNYIARQAGFTVWLDPQTKLSHGSHVGVTVSNMGQIHAALNGA